jgi:S1-C subfamily serine protease
VVPIRDQVGQQVFAIGNPFGAGPKLLSLRISGISINDGLYNFADFLLTSCLGLDHTLTSGIISGLGREISSPSGFPIRGVIQTDAAINPGNSGGVLLDSKGRLVGINTAIVDPTGSGTSSGALPLLSPVVADMKDEMANVLHLN